MEHDKRLHEEKVTLCWKFEAGICDFGESSCWFSHCQNRKFKIAKFRNRGSQENRCKEMKIFVKIAEILQF